MGIVDRQSSCEKFVKVATKKRGTRNDLFEKGLILDDFGVAGKKTDMFFGGFGEKPQLPKPLMCNKKHQ